MATNAVFNRDGWGQENAETQTDGSAETPESTVDSKPEPTEESENRPAATLTEVDAADPRSADAETEGREGSAVAEPERPADRGDHQPSSTPADRPVARVVETIDDPEPSSEPAVVPEGWNEKTDLPKAMTLESEVNGESVGQRIARWDPARLNLPRPSAGDAEATRSDNQVENADQRTVDQANAVAYITATKDQRPWLAPAAGCEPAVQAIYASLDQGTGHAHIRHGPALNQQSLAGRVERLEDPAQRDDNLRAQGVDGFESDKMHRCSHYATAIPDAHAFAAVVAALSERSDVQEALSSEWDGPRPDPIAVPISDLLGPDGHEYCIGFQLQGDPGEARIQRKQWVLAKASGADVSELPEPVASPVPTFEGGDIVVVFKRNHEASKFEINTIFPDPAES